MLLTGVDWLFRHTLRSVWFGIILLALIAGYIAIGSGMASVREFFEMDELAFFNAWPLRILMILLVVTLVVVTLERIPFTPARWGAWTVHAGIITLIFGGFIYYSQKIEGATLILRDQTVRHYFDRWERALYFQANGQVARAPLANLPRFHAYDESLGNASRLSDYSNLNPMSMSAQAQSAGEMVGVPGLRFSVVGYWPYANIRTRLAETASSKDVGFLLTLVDAPKDQPTDRVLIGTSPRYQRSSMEQVGFEHRLVANESEIASLESAAKGVHQLTVKVADFEKTLPVEVGQVIPLGETGYVLRIDAFDPAWQTMDRQTKPLLSMTVRSPKGEFRRQVLSEGAKPTDFLLGAEGAGPMGKRQAEPIDAQLAIQYRFNDPANLMPRDGLVRYTLLSIPGSAKTTVIGVGQCEKVSVQTLESSTGQISVVQPVAASEAMIAPPLAIPLPERERQVVGVTRSEHASGAQEYVEEVPREIRNKDDGQSGRKQVVRVLATVGDTWKQDILVPFSEHLMFWRGAAFTVPGSDQVLQLQLANNIRPLPVSIRLDKFEAEAYGGLEAGMGMAMRDFRSTITLTNPRSGERITETVYLNNPVFYDGGTWIFFQSGWDGDGQRFTILGVGNRPGVFIMAIGCGLILLGILYAFYAKPLIISTMKNRALERAKAVKLPSRTAQAVEA